MKTLARALAVLLCCLTSAAFAAPEAGSKPPPRVQIALLLDNSGSMQGLINQARTQLWRLVNEFATAKQHGQRIRLELALYEYGEAPRKLSGFTTNLDAVSEQLFGMGIRGGDEHCGQVIAQATRELEWSGNPDDLKLIYIAGNEPFTQGPVTPEAALSAAKKRGIAVNVINADGSPDATWRQGAALAGTPFMTINHNAAVAQVVAPQDAELAKLGAQLNSTYVGYGALGGAAVARQQQMDSAAASAAPAALAERVVTKSGANYQNGEWDLVDAAKSGKKVKADELPAELRQLNEGERAAFVAGKAKEREALQAKITELSVARKKFIAEQEKAQANAPVTLDKAMIDSARSAAEAKALSFE